ncbi:ethanolamine utilization protein EutJ [Tessaracoccus sp. MC1756]|uniref:ethanolamine utilization protein EutJ n=1 Tax=Tessaracoccus sp. MC1756 TaxID=2760311 RepID=UPI001C725A0C|nr:ethanolamine utilization protein EutJ [Tessaracoccus sp. MC1756]
MHVSAAASDPTPSSPAPVRRTMKAAKAALRQPQRIAPHTPIRVGVDLGTAFSVVMVTDRDGAPLAAATRFADVVRDGVVWDFAGAQAVIRELRNEVEAATGRTLTQGAVTIPPAVGTADHRAHGYVLEGAGIECTAVVDETTAANAVLGITDGAVVDIGGGTTGVAILRGGEVIANIDEPTGGTHLSLVIAGALKIPLAEAEKRKVRKREQEALLPLVHPTLEKISTIVRAAVAGHDVDVIHLVGGTAAFLGIADIMADITGIRTVVAPEPMLVTPLGVASFAEPIAQKGGH